MGWEYYGLTLAIYLGVNTMACWSLDLQFGTVGILNFGFIMFQAAGAYTAALLTVGPDTPLSGQFYFFGTSMPWPLPWLIAAAVGALLALVTGVFVMGPKRRDYQAIAMLVVAVGLYTVVSNSPRLLNGTAGIANIPRPFASLNFSRTSYAWLYLGITAVVLACVGLLVVRIRRSPWGRSLKAIRENRLAAAAFGVNVRRETLKVYVIGGAIAALSGAVLVQFISAWSPTSWAFAETFVYLTAIVVGGAGSTVGVSLGTFVVLTAIVEGVTFFPGFTTGTTVAAYQWIAISCLTIAFLWFRPKGLIPERRRRFPTQASPASMSAPLPDALAFVGRRDGVGES